VSVRSRWQHSATRWRLGNGRVRVSNAWYRAAGRHVQGARVRVSNWRNHRTWDRGRRDAARRAADQVRSRAPVYRDRINPGTGRPHRDDARLGRISDRSLARMRDSRMARGRSR
jgi:hypothetical protein